MLVVLPLAPNRVALFRGQEMRASRKIMEHRLYFVYAHYIERVDDNGLLVLPPCRDMPPQFHACMTAASRLLYLVNTNPQVYEDDPDYLIDPRQLIQSVATVYGVDPNEMMNYYSTVRRYLSHKELQHPITIEAGLTALQSRATSTTTIKRFH